MDDITVWFFGIYVVGTIIGYRWGHKRGSLAAVDYALDSLIAQGIIKTTKNSEGETEIHKWNE